MPCGRPIPGSKITARGHTRPSSAPSSVRSWRGHPIRRAWRSAGWLATRSRTGRCIPRSRSRGHGCGRRRAAGWSWSSTPPTSSDPARTDGGTTGPVPPRVCATRWCRSRSAEYRRRPSRCLPTGGGPTSGWSSKARHERSGRRRASACSQLHATAMPSSPTKCPGPPSSAQPTMWWPPPRTARCAHASRWPARRWSGPAHSSTWSEPEPRPRPRSGLLCGLALGCRLLGRCLLGWGLLGRRLLGCRLGRRAATLPGGAVALAALLLRLGDASAKRLHQVDDLAFLGRDIRHLGDLGTLDLGLDDLQQRLPVVVEELEIGLPDLVRPEHRLHDENSLAWAKDGQTFPIPQSHLHDRDPSGLLQCVAEQDIWLGVRTWLRVVRPVESGGVEIVERDERLHLHHLARRDRQVGEILVVEHDHVTAGQLVTLGDIGVGDLVAAVVAHPLVPDTATVGRMDLPEADVLLLGGGDEPDRDRYQAERDRPLPHRLHQPLPPTPASRSSLVKAPMATAGPVRRACHAMSPPSGTVVVRREGRCHDLALVLRLRQPPRLRTGTGRAGSGLDLRRV